MRRVGVLAVARVTVLQRTRCALPRLAQLHMNASPLSPVPIEEFLVKSSKPVSVPPHSPHAASGASEPMASPRVRSVSLGTARLGPEDRRQRTILHLIRRNHKVIKLLYQQFLSSLDQEVRKSKVYALIYEIAHHSSCQELIIYPFLQSDPRFSNDRALVSRSLENHGHLASDLKLIDSVRLGEPAYEAQLALVMRRFMKHADEEEQGLLLKMGEHLTEAEMLDMGERFENADTLVTSRPHPNAPLSGMTGVAAHIATKPIDLLRDRLQGRSESIRQEEEQARDEVQRQTEREMREKTTSP